MPAQLGGAGAFDIVDAAYDVGSAEPLVPRVRLVGRRPAQGRDRVRPVPPRAPTGPCCQGSQDGPNCWQHLKW